MRDATAGANRAERIQRNSAAPATSGSPAATGAVPLGGNDTSLGTAVAPIGGAAPLSGIGTTPGLAAGTASMRVSDSDRDGLLDGMDPDDDNDGIPDLEDMFDGPGGALPAVKVK